jgi:predicted CopG family antitoxin
MSGHSFSLTERILTKLHVLLKRRSLVLFAQVSGVREDEVEQKKNKMKENEKENTNP